MKNKETIKKCLSYSLNYSIFMLSFISLILNIVLIIIYLNKYDLENLYVDVIQNTWYDSPIVDISLKKENENYHRIKLLSLKNKDTFCDCSHVKNKSEQVFKGSCSKNGLILGCNQYNSSKTAHKFFNETLFISTYNGNYWTFYDRIRKNKYGELACKEDNHYILCGYLDIFKNPLCVLEGETCPLNNIDFSYNSNNELINIKYKVNGNPGYHIVNKIFASEIEDADFFDINQILTFKNITHYKKREEEKLFKLNYFVNKNSSKIDFYRANKFTNEPFPNWFNERNIYYYNIIYPGNKYENQITKLDIFLFNKLSIVIRIVIFIPLVFFITLSMFKFLNKEIVNYKCYSKTSNLIFLVIFLFAIILNILSFIAAHTICINLNEYIKEQQNKIENGNGLYPYYLDLANTILQFLVIIFEILFLYINSDKKEEMKEKDEGNILLENTIVNNKDSDLEE